MQAINKKPSTSYLDNTKTLEIMKFMVTISIQNIENEELKSKLERIIYNEDLELDNILNTINIEKKL